MSPSVVAATTTLQNFGLHPFRSLPSEFNLMVAHIQVHSLSSCKSSHPPCLTISPMFLHVDVKVMLATMFWLYSKSSLRVYLLCLLWKHLSHSHMESHSLSRKCYHDRPMINHKCRACRLHRWSVMLSMCVWMVWVPSLSSHVSASLQYHVFIFRLFTH